jgi:predicted  nucleic acid-binding Zn-ribbon protein
LNVITRPMKILPKTPRPMYWRAFSKLRVLPLVLIIVLIAIPNIPGRFYTGTHVYANMSQQEIDALNQKLKETEQKLKEIRAQKDQVNSQLSGEQKNQSKLNTDAQYLANVIRQTELQVEDLKYELEKLDLEVQILTKEKDQLEARLGDIEGQIKSLNGDLQGSMNLLYKMYINSPNFFEKNTNYEGSVISQEKQKALVTLIKKNISEVQSLQSDVQAKKDEIAAKQKEVSDLKDEKTAQTASLETQKQGLEWQRANKIKLASDSAAKQNALTSQKANIEQQIRQYESDLNALRNSLYIQAPSGTPIAAGQYLGALGRTGLSCDWGKPDNLPTNYFNYCSYLGSNWYYYPPAQYPTKGAHLHFEYRLKGANSNVDPAKYLSTFVKTPTDNMNITQGFSGSHNAIDIAGGYGAPVRAVKAGKVIYRCDAFPADPAYGAVVYHDDGTITQYWHLQRPASVKC